MKSRITVGLLMSALLLPAAVLAETTRCTPKHTEGDTIIAVDCKVLSAEEIQKSAIENLSTNAGTKDELLGWHVTSDKIAKQTKYFLEVLNIKTTPAFIVTATKNPDVNNTTMLTGVVDEKTLLSAVEKAKGGE